MNKKTGKKISIKDLKKLKAGRLDSYNERDGYKTYNDGKGYSTTEDGHIKTSGHEPN